MSTHQVRTRVELALPAGIRKRLQTRAARYQCTQAEMVEYALRTAFNQLSDLASSFEDDARDADPDLDAKAYEENADWRVGEHIRGCCELSSLAHPHPLNR